MDNKKFSIIFLLVLAFAGLYYKDTLQNIWRQSFHHYFPCKQPITYSIGTFDTKFGISKEEFLKDIALAENIWEKSINKDLFKYDPSGDLKINLIYDVRQEATTKLKQMGLAVDNSKSTYDSLVLKYKALVTTHDANVLSFHARIETFESRKQAYEEAVVSANRRGGANKQTYAELSAEKDYLNSEAINLKNLQSTLNDEADQINTMVVTINQIATNLNIDVKQYNIIGESLPSEFDEGLYKSSSQGQEIDVYQYDNKTKLIRVLAHEFGHALGLEHVEDQKAIMYRLNNGINEKLTITDLTALKKLCGIK